MNECAEGKSYSPPLLLSRNLHLLSRGLVADDENWDFPAGCNEMEIEVEMLLHRRTPTP